MQWTEAIAKLHSFGDLAPDWDGDGSPPPPADLVARAVRISLSLEALGTPPPNFVSFNTDTMTITWLSGKGQYAMLNFVASPVVCDAPAADCKLVVGCDLGEPAAVVLIPILLKAL